MNSCTKLQLLTTTNTSCETETVSQINSETLIDLNSIKQELIHMNKAVDVYQEQINNLLTELRIEDKQRKENMESFTEEQSKDAQEFSEFYIDLIENHRETFIYYLSETATLDWFGQTIKGIKNIEIFLKNKVANVRHLFPRVEPCAKIGYRDSHVVKYSLRETRKRTLTKVGSDDEKTPPKQAITIPGGSKIKEIGQGDGVHNCPLESPAKRLRLSDGEIIEPENATPPAVLNISSEGHVEFHKKSTKKYQRETKWSRPCKFQVAYSKISTEYVIHLIIYEGNMKCKRNLLKDFDASVND